jgi:hypothetical protein
MSETGMTLAIKPLARRFAAPALAAWLLYLGVWILLFAIEQPVMAWLTQTAGWFIWHLPYWRYPYSGTVETTSWRISLFAQNMAEGVVLILLGLLLGSWIARRKRRSLSQPS